MHWFNLSHTTKTVVRYGKPCKDECQSGESYFWCNTLDGWDYCSPTMDAPNPIFGATFWTTAAVLEFIMIP